MIRVITNDDVIKALRPGRPSAPDGSRKRTFTITDEEYVELKYQLDIFRLKKKKNEI